MHSTSSTLAAFGVSLALSHVSHLILSLGQRKSMLAWKRDARGSVLPVPPLVSWLPPERPPLLPASLPALLDWGSSTCFSKSHGVRAIRKETSITYLES